MEDKVDRVVDGAVETAHRLLVTSALIARTVVLTNVRKDPQEEVEDLTRTPADYEGDDQQKEHLHGLRDCRAKKQIKYIC